MVRSIWMLLLRLVSWHLLSLLRLPSLRKCWRHLWCYRHRLPWLRGLWQLVLPSLLSLELLLHPRRRLHLVPCIEGLRSEHMPLLHGIRRPRMLQHGSRRQRPLTVTLELGWDSIESVMKHTHKIKPAAQLCDNNLFEPTLAPCLVGIGWSLSPATCCSSMHQSKFGCSCASCDSKVSGSEIEYQQKLLRQFECRAARARQRPLDL